MEKYYESKMSDLGYNQKVTDIFINWESVKDELLLKERKDGTGNGTVHVFLGAADSVLRMEFASYYDAVENGEDPVVGAVTIKHYFVVNNVLSMIGYLCQYFTSKQWDFAKEVKNIISELNNTSDESGLLVTQSYFKLSTGSSSLRPYFKQFDEKGVFHRIIRHLLLPNSAYKISLFKDDEGNYAAFWLIGFNTLSNFEATSSKNLFSDEIVENAYQRIIYGAPGTGKSNSIKKYVEEAEKNKRVFRTTFHPDSDYSTFVGCYKPTMKPTGVSRGEVKEEAIVYKFVPQAFTKAYIKAWHTTEDVFLIIEEINRGNCAQIFGDLFQLLDRKNGVSEYPIDADSDLADYLNKKLKDSERVFPNGVKEGEKLVLPNNLYIWATMNTSDQSLFPIDSAFKRRWEWKYIPIKEHSDKKYTIRIGTAIYDWWGFLVRINDVIYTTTNSEDKKLGYFFAKTEDNVIKAEQFVGKVLFYLWNDVFKNYGFDNSIFDKIDKNKFAFSDFFLADGSPDLANINAFMNQLDDKIKKEEPMIIKKVNDIENNEPAAE